MSCSSVAWILRDTELTVDFFLLFSKLLCIDITFHIACVDPREYALFFPIHNNCALFS